jgi:hypothetical protein
MWATMPDVMLSKCSESLALRAAFPNELSGVYTAEEMGQSTNDDAPARSTKATRSLDDVAYDSETGEVLAPPAKATKKQETGEAAELIKSLVDVDLPQCIVRASLVVWARELLAITASSKAKEAAWKAWASQCADHELAPAELAAEARKPL